MELKLLSGTFSAEEAERLLTSLIKVKIDFHTAKINTAMDNEEDIKASERRIIDLERSLKSTLELLRTGGYKQFTVSAKAIVELCPRYEGA